jgi:hypothetical protein
MQDVIGFEFSRAGLELLQRRVSYKLQNHSAYSFRDNSSAMLETLVIMADVCGNENAALCTDECCRLIYWCDHEITWEHEQRRTMPLLVSIL